MRSCHYTITHHDVHRRAVDLLQAALRLADHEPKCTARVVGTVLAWAAEPHADQRKTTGLAVMIYLLLFAGVLYASYKRLWKNVEH